MPAVRVTGKVTRGNFPYARRACIDCMPPLARSGRHAFDASGGARRGAGARAMRAGRGPRSRTGSSAAPIRSLFTDSEARLKPNASPRSCHRSNCLGRPHAG